MIKDKKKRAIKIVKLLKEAYPDACCSLNYKAAFELLTATILSAQTTDEQVNKITPPLFKKYKSIEDFAGADSKTLEKDIKSIGLYRNKARAIKGSAQMILHEFGGEMPQTLKELVRLPGVGRKTASVMLGTWFNIAEGIVVDTHVQRISRLLGLTSGKNADKVEQDLMKTIPQKDWIIFTHLLIDHGRAVCIARRPQCHNCILRNQCPSAL